MRLRIYAEAESNASLLAIAGAQQYTPPAPQASLAALAVSPSAFPPPGKVPGIPAKTVHFPPRLAGVPAPQASLAVPAIPSPRGKCRVFPRKRFTFPRGRQGYRLHRPLWPHLAFPPPGKVPGFSAKTVHFPPQLAGAPAPQASLAALGISTPGESAGFFRENGSLSPWLAGAPAPQTPLAAPAISTSGESAGFFRENGSLSPVAGWATGSTDLSRRTCHFHLPGKCREFLRKRFTFPRGRQGHRLHRHLWRHSPFPPPGKVPGFSTKMVHFPPWPAGVPAPQASLAAPAISTSGESAGFFHENGSLSPVARMGTGSTGLSRRTHRFHPWGKCRVFPRKRFTFPRGLNGRADIGPTDLKTLSYLVTGKGAYE